MRNSHSLMALLTTICFLGIACTEAPMDSGELAGPEFAKGGEARQADVGPADHGVVHGRGGQRSRNSRLVP